MFFSLSRIAVTFVKYFLEIFFILVRFIPLFVLINNWTLKEILFF